MKQSRKSNTDQIFNRPIHRSNENNDNDVQSGVLCRSSGQLRRWRPAPRAHHDSRKWKAVMGARCVCSTLAVAPFPFLVQLLILCLMANAAKPHECLVDQCVREHQKSLDLESGAASAHRNCLVLRNYMDCLRGTARSCRGDLSYHSISSLLTSWNSDFNCSYVNTTDEQLMPTLPTKPTRRPPPKECVYSGRHPDFRWCSLFGDPHLVTFGGDAQTCKVLGTWPLIDNAYLAVQVTNEAVAKGSKASATSMVTIIIKGHAPCSDEKTYEAQTSNFPATFVDGTQWSGIDGSVRIKEREPGRHVEISIKYIATTISLRQVGQYLTFSIRAPRDVAFLGAKRDGLHLCVKGCPSTELIDHKHVLTHPKSLGGSQHGGMAYKVAEAQCKQHNVIGFYFDSCVFDLVATGDNSFGQAASEAMKDSLALGKNSSILNLNRTAAIFTKSPNLVVSDTEETARELPSSSGSPRQSTDVRWWLLCSLLILYLTNK